LSQITLQTRTHDASAALDAYSELMNRAERTIHARLLAGRKWTGDLAVSLYDEFDMSAKLMESAYAARQAKVKSATELAKLHAHDLREKAKNKREDIQKKTKRLNNLRKDFDRKGQTILKAEAWAAKLQNDLENAPSAKRLQCLQRYKSMLGVLHRERQDFIDFHAEIRRIERVLHQHKRRAENLGSRLVETMKRIDRASICFGSRKLFEAQFRLKENGFRSHAEWRKAWREMRSSTFMIEGCAAKGSGNQFARLTLRGDMLFDLELRLPEALKHLAEESRKIGGVVVHLAWIRGLEFKHQAEELAIALTRGIPISVRFHRDGNGWRIMPTFKAEMPEAREDYACGTIGVDVNVGFVSVAHANRHGNVIAAFDIPMVTYGMSQDQSKDAVIKAAVLVAEYAERHGGLPVVSEMLDFARKKKRLKEDGDARYARMLSSFVYSSFDAGLATACARRGVYHRRVNPAYTSIIGRVKFARRYGLSTHRSAALAIARRAMQLSEKLPLTFKEGQSVGVPLNDTHHVTLELPVRKDPGSQGTGTRHVWSDWNEVGKALRDAHAARRPSGRRTRVRKPRSVMGPNDLHSMVCRSRGKVSEKLHPAAGSAD
jgi:IS605 OrfB family transposase